MEFVERRDLEERDRRSPNCCTRSGSSDKLHQKIDRQDVSPMCRLCREREETVSHITAECKKLAQNQSKNWRHDKVAQVVHWNLCKKIYLQCSKTWYDHSPEIVMENDQVKLLWDFRIQTATAI